MIADLILLGVFSAARYDTPPSRTITIPVRHTPLKLPDKLVGDNLDYCLDWTARLDGDVISKFGIDVPTGDVIVSRQIFNDNTSSFWLSAGRAGNGSTVRVLVQTIGGRTFEELFPIRCL